MWLIVGLGNPGDEYAGTYHNVGFRVLDRLAARENVRMNECCGAAVISDEIQIRGQAAVLVKPQTYMNKSGAAMPPVFDRFGASTQNVIVIYDDVALPLGKIRVRQRGSAGGHNGIKSLISTFGSDEFLRVRIGIQPERELDDLREFVLSRVAQGDRDLLNQAEEVAVKAVEAIIGEGIGEAMSQYNGIDLREKEN
ncbi:MAG TPA: aminoacyl-tRNA hydrolase [Terriglobia bacterium]|nr:aminoacyl-tRNA hydrolase [Terriglobia bacterium]